MSHACSNSKQQSQVLHNVHIHPHSASHWCRFPFSCLFYSSKKKGNASKKKLRLLCLFFIAVQQNFSSRMLAGICVRTLSAEDETRAITCAVCKLSSLVLSTREATGWKKVPEELTFFMKHHPKFMENFSLVEWPQLSPFLKHFPPLWLSSWVKQQEWFLISAPWRVSTFASKIHS